MNPKLFIGDFVLLLVFISQGTETHNSDSSFLEILIPFLISMLIMIPLFYKIGFLKMDNKPEYVKSLRIWISTISIGVLIRFVTNNAFEPLFLFVIICYFLTTSGIIRLVHSRF
ncbi:MAG: hypothetical protein CXT75_05670 [Methanobacteriota archaeon]|nr:MAG: hypothetical protein CXT75_05670 [Euryarchaeota archaeon]